MIIGNRVYLRSFDRKYVAIRTQWMNDPDVRSYLNNPFPVSESSTESWLSKINSDPSRIDLIICLKENDKPIGYTGYRDIDFMNGKAEIYIGIGEKKYLGKGLAKESLLLSLNYILSRYNLNSVYAKMIVKNEDSIGLFRNVGFQEDGVLRSHIFSKGKYRDMKIMSILREEFWRPSAQ